MRKNELKYKPIIGYSKKDGSLNRKTAIEESIKLWSWLADTGANHKNYHPEFNIVYQYDYSCFLCELYYKEDFKCKECPLVNCDQWSIHEFWAHKSHCQEDKQKYAKKIVNKLQKAYKNEFGEKFNPYID